MGARILSGKSIHYTTPCHEKRHQECALKQSYLWYYEFFVCHTFFFTQNVSMGTSVRFFVKGVQITSTLIIKYHTPLYLPLFFIQFYFLVWSLASYRGYCVRPLFFLIFLLISTHYWYPISMAMFKANRSKRTDNVCDFSSVRLHQIPLRKRPHHHRLCRSLHQPVKGCAI